MRSGAARQGKRGAQSLDTRLAALLESRVDGLRGPLSIEPIPGGRSNPTFLLRSPTGDYVLRSRPPEPVSPSAHRIDREVRVLNALAGTNIPVPRVLLHVEDATCFGAPFYLMTRVDGTSIESPALPDLAIDRRAAAYTQAIDVLAALHALEPEALALAGFGREGDYNARQLVRWSQQVAHGGDAPAALGQLADALAQRLPRQTRTRIVHGDYRFANLLLMPDGAISAILDWELSTLGDPFGDLAYFLLVFDLPETGQVLPGLAGARLSDLGIPDADALAQHYCRAAGITLPESWPAYRALALYRTAAIAHGVFSRNARGRPIGRHQSRQLQQLAEIGLARLGRSAAS